MKENHFILQTLDRALDFVLNFFSACLAFYICVGKWYHPYFNPGLEMLLNAGLICLMSVFLYGHYNVYKPMRTKGIAYFLSRIFFVNLLVAGICTGLILVWRKAVFEYYLVWMFLAEGISLFLMFSKKLSMMLILHRLRTKRKNVKFVLIITDSQEMVDDYMDEIHNNPQFGYSVIGYVGNLNVVGLPHLGRMNDLDHIIREFRPDEVVMAFETVRKKDITQYVDVCNDNCCKVLFVPAICGYFRAPRQVTGLGTLPLIDIRSNPLDNPTNQAIKRLTDIVISTVLIVLTSPLMLFTAIGVKLSSKGPILFSQTRIGKNNQPFTMYKFRSMRVNDSETTGWSHEGDPRKTRFGAFIRKFALDELPQFFNVLKGDMSLVGPRPEVPFYVEKFKKEVPLYMLKHTLRPGITGLAQIKGLRGDTSIADRIEEDINYIEHWTFWGDIRILLLTPFKAVNRHENYVKKESEHAKRLEEKERRIYVSGVGARVDHLLEENADPIAMNKNSTEESIKDEE